MLKFPVNFIFHLFHHVFVILLHQFFVLSHPYLIYFFIFHISKMSSIVHSFSALSFLEFPTTSLFSVAEEVSTFISYHFSSHYLATDRILFRTLLRAEGSRFPLSLLLSLIENDGFTERDLLDIIHRVPIKFVRLLGEAHFYLSFRMHTIYWAIVINLHSILERRGDREDPHPWISVADLLDDYNMITDDMVLIKAALSSNVPNNIEPRMVDNMLQIRVTPNIYHFINPFDITNVHSPFDHGSRNIEVPSKPNKLYRDNIQRAYNPIVFRPMQLHIHNGSLIVSIQELVQLFPGMTTFKLHTEGCYLTVDNHLVGTIEEHLVELYSTDIRVVYAGEVADARICIYDSDRYSLVWSSSKYSLRCKYENSIHACPAAIDVSPTTFLDARFVF